MILTDGTRMVDIVLKRGALDISRVESISEDVFCDLKCNKDGIYEAEDVDISIETARNFAKGIGEYDFDHTAEPTCYIGLDIYDLDTKEMIEEAPIDVREWYRH